MKLLAPNFAPYKSDNLRVAKGWWTPVIFGPDPRWGTNQLSLPYPHKKKEKCIGKQIKAIIMWKNKAKHQTKSN